jgi:hypothetical protein
MSLPLIRTLPLVFLQLLCAEARAEVVSLSCSGNLLLRIVAGVVERMGLGVVIEGVQRFGVKVSESKA